MGIELLGKAFILAELSSEYESLKDQEAKHKIDEIAKDIGHDLKSIFEKVNNFMGQDKINQILGCDFDSFTGNQFVRVLEAGYIEARYPVPVSIAHEFPLEGRPGIYWQPLSSSGLSKFSFSIGREILSVLKSKFNIGIKKSEIERIILPEEVGVRFCRLFFDNDISRYTI